ncbi:ABC-type ATPase involved in cell division, partial [Rhizobium petrolearium]|nr:ABC-type ATPase involved in cell division [Neorhizobium petrolearium]
RGQDAIRRRIRRKVRQQLTETGLRHKKSDSPAWLEHGIQLNLTLDRYPKGIEDQQFE